MSTTPAGWFPDPQNHGQLRYWDGSQWTNHRAPDPGASEPTTEIPDVTAGGPAPPSPAPAPYDAPSGVGHTPSTTGGAEKQWWQQTWVAAVAALIVGALLVSSLGDDDDQEPAAAVTQPVETVTETAETTETATPTPEPKPEPKPKPKPKAQTNTQAGSGVSGFVMPNEVGKTLQGAQDHLQEVSGDPFYVSFSEDATGQQRFQVLDSGWQVCRQNPAPGAIVSPRDEVWFYAVKLTESCP